MVASECVDTSLRGSKPGVVCKLDIEKAFDDINWKFLLSIPGKWVLEEYG